MQGIIPKEVAMDRYIELLKSLPPLVAAVTWDVVNQHITQTTVDLAQATSTEEFEKYDLVRCIAAANPSHPPLDLAQGLVDEMVETAIVAR